MFLMFKRILASRQRSRAVQTVGDGQDDLWAELFYMKAMRARPRNFAQTPPPGEPQTNATFETCHANVRNLRQLVDPPSLDVQGFTLVIEPTMVNNFYDDREVCSIYYTEVETLLKKITGASRVVVFDHRTRRRVNNPGQGIETPRQPLHLVHVDYTANSGAQAARSATEGGAIESPSGRVQIINVWRPIRGPLSDAPLAVCDARTVDPMDLVATDLVYPDKVWETYSVTSNPRHRWFYAPRMSVDEALLFKCFDSETDGRARFTPHAAFDDPTAPAHTTIPRESIEVRALVFD